MSYCTRLSSCLVHLATVGSRHEYHPGVEYAQMPLIAVPMHAVAQAWAMSTTVQASLKFYPIDWLNSVNAFSSVAPVQSTHEYALGKQHEVCGNSFAIWRIQGVVSSFMGVNALQKASRVALSPITITMVEGFIPLKAYLEG